MKKIGDILKQNRVKEKLSKREKKEILLFSSWREAAGEMCCSHTVKLSLQNGVLGVKIDSPVWRQELIMKDLDSLAEYMAKKTGYTIAKIKIRTGGWNTHDKKSI